jgi:membrane-bound acyltransferase YfiQ involved in biofilm formation
MDTISTNNKQVGAITIYEFFLCLFVIFIHVSAEGISVGNKDGLFSGVLFVLNRSASFVVPAFIFVSALKLTLRYKDTPITVDYYLRRFAKVYIPYIIWVVIYYVYFLYQDYLSFSLNELGAYIFNGTLAAHFYFIVIILQFYLLLPLFLYFAKKVHVVAGLAIALIIMGVYRFYLPNGLDMFHYLPFDRWFLGYLLFGMMGVYYAFYYEAFNEFLGKLKLEVIVVLLLIPLPHLVMSYLGYIGVYHYHLYEYVQILFCMVMLSGFYLVCLEYLVKYQKLLRNAGKITFFVFMSHILVLYLVEDFLLVPQDWLIERFLVKLGLVYLIPFVGAVLYALLKEKLFRLRQV